MTAIIEQQYYLVIMILTKIKFDKCFIFICVAKFQASFFIC